MTISALRLEQALKTAQGQAVSVKIHNPIKLHLSAPTTIFQNIKALQNMTETPRFQKMKHFY
jgi:hypothetical protein